MTKAQLIAEAKRIQEDCLYSAKGHFEVAGRWTRVHFWLGIPSAALAAIAGASALAEFDSNNVVAGVLALVVAALTAISTFLNPNQRAGQHKVSGNQYLAIRNKVRVFADLEVDFESNKGLLLEQLKELGKERDDQNERSPQIPRWAYERAKKGIAEGEAQHEVDG